MEQNTFFGQEKACDRSCDALRVALKTVGAQMIDIKAAISHESSEAPKDVNVGEMLANITLAYRAVEDAAMRLGKVKQHNNNGVSIYDKNVVGSPEKSVAPAQDMEEGVSGETLSDDSKTTE